MDNSVRPWRATFVAALLVVTSSGAATAQAQIEPSSPEPASSSPGLAEVALCSMPELGEKAGSVGPLIASIADIPISTAQIIVDTETRDTEAPPITDFGCSYPREMRLDPLTRQMEESILFPGSSDEEHVIVSLHAFDTELTAREVRDVLARPDVFEAGRPGDFGAGEFIVLEMEHEVLPDDVGVNFWFNFDGKGWNDAPAGVASPSNPQAGFDGGFTVFPEQVLVTDTPGEFYQGNPRKHPVAAMRSPNQTAILVPADSVGPTFAPFIFMENTYHVVQGFPNGAGPVDGRFPLVTGCGPSQQIVHESLTVNGQAVSAYTNWFSACFPLEDPLASRFAGALGEQPFRVPVLFDSYDSRGRRARPQQSLAEITFDSGAAYIRFPSGILGPGYHHVTNVEFNPVGDEFLNSFLLAAGSMFGAYAVPIEVDASSTIYQAAAPCLEPGAQEQPVG